MVVYVDAYKPKYKIEKEIKVMTRWEVLLNGVGADFTGDGEFLNIPVMMTPIGYKENGLIQEAELSSTDVHAIVVGYKPLEVTNMARVLCEGFKSLYGDSLDCKIFGMASGYWSAMADGCCSDRYLSSGRRTIEEMAYTDNEAMTVIYMIESLVTSRVRLLSLTQCKTSFEWNNKLQTISGSLMTDEDVYCLGMPKGTVWSSSYRMENKIFILNGFLDFFRLLPMGKSSTVDRLLNTILRLGRSVGVHLVVTGSTLLGMKKAFVDMLSLRILLRCSEAASKALLDGLGASGLFSGQAMMISSEMVRPVVITEVPIMTYDDEGVVESNR